MTDIQQWRRMIQPARAAEHDTDGLASPTTPKRGLKPKFSSYFTNGGGSALAVRAEPSFTSLNGDVFAPPLPTWPEDEPYPDPKADGLVDLIMCKLLSKPYDGLDARHNGALLQIFECYRHAVDQATALQVQLKDEVGHHTALLRRLQHSQKQWTEERQDYRSEVKRLELLLATGKHGLAEVTLARQDSQFRQREVERSSRPPDDGLETIFEFLEKTKRHEDKAWNAQRATFRTKRSSPSAGMRRLSKQLESNTSMNLLFSTPAEIMPMTLADGPMLEDQASTDSKHTENGVQAMSQPKTSLSDGTFSTFSCVGDLLPDETVHIDLLDTMGTTDNDPVANERILSTLVRRPDVNPTTMLPKLVFGLNDPPAQPLNLQHVAHTSQLQTPKSLRKTATNIQKHPSLMAKASGFFHKRLRPQLTVDTVATAGRRFSFETGDDAVTIIPPVDMPVNTQSALRKSTSLMTLGEMAHRAAAIERTLSPVAQSPVTSAPPSEQRRASKIPTAVHIPTHYARPRRGREDSTSSLLTAIQNEGISWEGGSVSSSGYSSPSASRIDMFQGTEQSLGRYQRSGSSNRLLDHSKLLRGNASASAAAKSVCKDSPGHESCHSPQHMVTRVQSRGQCSGIVCKSAMSQEGIQNIAPIAPPDNLVAD